MPSLPPPSCDIDLDAPGRRLGHITLPMPDAEPLRIPIAVFVNGEGPSVLFTGAVHGDEYDGPITLLGLVRSLRLDDIHGRLIVVPVLNLPAMQAGTRVSPLDGLDLNRSFPGDPAGSPSQRLADWVSRELVPRVEAVVDAHTGGSFTDWIPLVMMHPVADAGQYARMLDLVRAMRPPLGIVLNENEKPGMFDTFVERAGKVFVCCEFGGGTMTMPSLAVAGVCLRNALRHFGMLGGAAETPHWPAFPAPRLMQAPDLDWAVAATRDGVYQPVVELGETVAEGQILGWVHPIDDLAAPPEPALAPIAGTLFFRPASARVVAGTRLGMVCRDL